MPDISKIRLPGSNTDYDIKDAVARQMISGGVSFIIAWDGTTAPTVAQIPEGVVVTYNGTNYTGTLDADNATAGAFYLVKSATTPSAETLDVYDEYVPVGTTGSKSWEKIGDTQLNLTDVVTGVSLSKQTDVVLGEATTFTAGSSSVTFTGNSTDKVLGEATTFTGVDPTITVTPTTTEIKATATGGGAAWNSKDQKTVVTGYTPGASNKDTFVKSVTAETGKNLVTTTITGTNGTESVSKVTKTASKLVTTTVPNVTGNTSVTIPNVTSAGSASTWTFEMGDGSDAETLIISGANSTAPTLGTALTATNTTLGTAKTVATGGVASDGSGSDIVTAVTVSDKTVAKAASSATTVATGATSTTGTGDAVVTGVTVGESADALISLPSPSTATVIGSSSTFTNTQPTVKLTSGATAVSGTTVNVATGIASASASGTGVTVGTNDKVTAITGLGTGTAAAQTITVGTNDKVTVLKNTTDVSVTKGNS